MRQAGEPSVEAILESIKKVIARDNLAIAAGSVPELERELDHEAVSGGDDADKVLNLSDADLAAPIESTDEGVDPLTDPVEEEAVPLAAESTHGAVRGSLENLALAAEAGPPAEAADAATSSGDAPFEALVREMLRPALAEWLDTHMPPMVERLVAAEIARIVGKRG